MKHTENILRGDCPCRPVDEIITASAWMPSSQRRMQDFYKGRGTAVLNQKNLHKKNCLPKITGGGCVSTLEKSGNGVPRVPAHYTPGYTWP